MKTPIKKSREVSFRCQAFTGHKICTHDFTVFPDGAVRVWDPVADIWTTCHCLSDADLEKIRAKAADEAAKEEAVYAQSRQLAST